MLKRLSSCESLLNCMVPHFGTQRLRYLDFARTVLFFLGIVLHAAWLLRHQNPVFQVIHDVIHSFRMQGFFLIAGFFSALMLARYTPQEFLQRRLRRLAIPLLSFLIIVTLLDCANLTGWTDYSPELNKAYWISGEWMQHLWFLATLLAYVIAAFALREVFDVSKLQVPQINLRPIFFFAAVVLTYFVSTHVERVFHDDTLRQIWGVAEQIRLFAYVAYFAAGFFLFRHRSVLDAITSASFANILSIAFYWTLHEIPGKTMLAERLLHLWQPIYCLNVAGLIFWIGRRFFSESRAIERLSAASYTIYLVHWPILVILNRIFIKDGLPAPVLFAVYVSFTSILAYAMHIYVVDRSPVLAFLMNGRSFSHPDSEAEIDPEIPARWTAPVTSR